MSCLEQPENDCSRRGECVTLRFWQMLYDAINEVVDKVTLADLAEWERELKETVNYVI